MTGHPFSLTGPAVMTLRANSAGTFKVINTGTSPLVVRESLGRTNLKALHYPAASHATLTQMGQPWIQVSPSNFRLAPGASQVIRISDHVPAGVQGNHYLQIVWTAAPAHQAAGNMHLQGAVATTVTIPLPGAAVPVTTAPLPRAPLVPPSGGVSALLLLIPALLVALALAAVVAWRMRRGHPAPA